MSCHWKFIVILEISIFILYFFRLVGAFVHHSPEYCFVVRDHAGVCGYVLAAPNARLFFERVENSWIPTMTQKYSRPEKTESLSPSEVKASQAPKNFKILLFAAEHL